jgi:2-polyprenyl-3-methyl-5-hydroxy-6-metoxy-1,4-benzoquinol methylase
MVTQTSTLLPGATGRMPRRATPATRTRLVPVTSTVSDPVIETLRRGAAEPLPARGVPVWDDPEFFRAVLKAYESRVIRVYLRARFAVIRGILADLLDNLPATGTVLNLGSGIGLFDIYGARHRPEALFIGVDQDARRIELSRAAADRLGLDNVQFLCADVTRDLPAIQPDVVIAIDLLHHVPPAAQQLLLAWTAQHLSRDGIVFIKDISTRVRWRLRFTKVLDDLMTGREPVHYFPSQALQRDLQALGFRTTTFHLWDYIPFPHVIYIARRA